MKHSSIKLLFAALIISGPIYGASDNITPDNLSGSSTPIVPIEKTDFYQSYLAEKATLAPMARALLEAIEKMIQKRY